MILDIVKTTYSEATAAQRDQPCTSSMLASSPGTTPLTRGGGSGGGASERDCESELVAKVTATGTGSPTIHSQGSTSESPGCDCKTDVKQDPKVATSSLEETGHDEKLRTTGSNSEHLPERHPAILQDTNTLTGAEMKESLLESVASQLDSNSRPHSTASTAKEVECEGGSGHSNEGAAEVEDPDCTECGIMRPDPTPKELVMYLHALSYKV